METLTDGPLAHTLAAGRSRFNARFLLARQTVGAVQPDAFASHLVRAVDPLVRTLHTLDPARTERIVETLFDLSLELVARNLAGPNTRVPLTQSLWNTLLPAIASHVQSDPQRVCASLTNAVVRLSGEPSVSAQTWLSRMTTLGPRTRNVDELLRLGQVLAWRGGMAHWRKQAFEQWQQLDPALQLAVFDTPSATPEALRTVLTYRWNLPSHTPASPSSALGVVATVGNFVGLGGTFHQPPRVFLHNDTLHATDGTSRVSLHADAFGAVLLPEPDVAEPTGPFRAEFLGGWSLARSVLRLGNASFTLPSVTSVAGTHDTVAFTLAHSHRIHLVALQSSPPRG